MAKKKSSGFEAAAVFIGLIVVLTSIPKGVWIFIGCAVVVYLICRGYDKEKSLTKVPDGSTTGIRPPAIERNLGHRVATNLFR